MFTKGVIGVNKTDLQAYIHYIKSLYENKSVLYETFLQDIDKDKFKKIEQIVDKECSQLAGHELEEIYVVKQADRSYIQELAEKRLKQPFLCGNAKFALYRLLCPQDCVMNIAYSSIAGLIAYSAYAAVSMFLVYLGISDGVNLTDAFKVFFVITAGLYCLRILLAASRETTMSNMIVEEIQQIGNFTRRQISQPEYPIKTFLDKKGDIQRKVINEKLTVLQPIRIPQEDLISAYKKLLSKIFDIFCEDIQLREEFLSIYDILDNGLRKEVDVYFTDINEMLLRHDKLHCTVDYSPIKENFPLFVKDILNKHYDNVNTKEQINVDVIAQCMKR